MFGMILGLGLWAEGELRSGKPRRVSLGIQEDSYSFYDTACSHTQFGSMHGFGGALYTVRIADEYHNPFHNRLSLFDVKS